MSDEAERERARYEALAGLVEGYRRERDEARAEVRVLQELLMRSQNEREQALCRQEDLEADVRYYEDRWERIVGGAYQRGAEDMREACQQWCRAWENDGEAIADALADLQVEET